MSLHVGRSPWRHGLPKWGNITWSEISLLLLRRFVFRMVEASAKREWPVMNRNGPWEGYRRRAKRLCPLSPSLLPLRAHLHRERDVWAQVKCEMGKQKIQARTVYRSFLLIWSEALQNNFFLHEKTAQSPEDFFGTLFNMAAVSMFRIPIWPAVTSYDSLQI